MAAMAFFNSFHGLALLVGPLGDIQGHMTICWEQIQLGARLGGMDFHRSQQSTTSSQQQSTSGRPRATYYQAYGDIIAVNSGGLTSILLVLDQFLSDTQKQSTVMFQIVFVRQPFQASWTINHCFKVISF
jgi:hypothetical protein